MSEELGFYFLVAFICAAFVGCEAINAYRDIRKAPTECVGVH